MTPKQIAELFRERTGTTTDTMPDSSIISRMRGCMDDMSFDIFKRNSSLFGTPYEVDLKANTREYALDEEVLNSEVLLVEAYLSSKWTPLHRTSLEFTPVAIQESNIIGRYSNFEGAAFYAIWRGSLWILSGAITAVTKGLRYYSFTWPQHIEDLTSEFDMSIALGSSSHGFPREFHQLLLDRMIIQWKGDRDKPIALTQYEQLFEKRYEKRLSQLKDPAPIVAQRPRDYYLRTGNNGFNL